MTLYVVTNILIIIIIIISIIVVSIIPRIHKYRRLIIRDNVITSIRRKDYDFVVLFYKKEDNKIRKMRPCNELEHMVDKMLINSKDFNKQLTNINIKFNINHFNNLPVDIRYSVTTLTMINYIKLKIPFELLLIIFEYITADWMGEHDYSLLPLDFKAYNELYHFNEYLYNS